MEVIDVHQHIGDLNNVWETEMHGLTASLDEEFRSRVQAMKDIGIDCAVLQPSHGYLKPDGIRDTMRVNDGIAAYRKRDPARFPYALGTVEPTHGERSLEEIDRTKHVLGLNGLSWHHRFQEELLRRFGLGVRVGVNDRDHLQVRHATQDGAHPFVGDEAPHGDALASATQFRFPGL